jgi:hypothetical protein
LDQRGHGRKRPASAAARCSTSGVRMGFSPAFGDKLRDVVGLYVDPPAHAVAFSVDEKRQIQALDRPQPGLPWPGLPMKRGHV